MEEFRKVVNSMNYAENIDHKRSARNGIKLQHIFYIDYHMNFDFEFHSNIHKYFKDLILTIF